MNRFFKAIVASLFLLPVAAWTHGIAAPVYNGEIQHTNFFTGYANQSGQTYSGRPGWSVAGVDEGEGVDSTVVGLGLLNPAVFHPPNCPYTAPGTSGNLAAGAGQITCSNAANCNVQGYDFTGVYLRFMNTCTVTATIKNNRFKLTSNMLSPNLGLIYANDVEAACFDIEKNSFDGRAFVLGTAVPAGGSDGAGISDILLNSTCSSDLIAHNAFINTPGRPLIYAANVTTAHLYVLMNYIEGFVPYQPQGHGEFAVTNAYPYPTVPGFAGLHYSYNTVLQPPGVCSCGAAAFFIAANDGQYFTNVMVDHNTVVMNGAGGGPVDNNFALVGTIDNGSGTRAGHVLTVTSTAKSIHVGQTLISGAIDVSILDNISGSGAGSKWDVDDDTSYTPSYNTGSKTWNANSASMGAALFELGNDVYPNPPIVTSNWMDLTGAFTSTAANTGSRCTGGPAVFSDNVNMVTGAAITTWGQAGGSPRC